MQGLDVAGEGMRHDSTIDTEQRVDIAFRTWLRQEVGGVAGF